MFTRRIFVQGTAALISGLIPAIAGAAAKAAPVQGLVLLDSIETPMFQPVRGQRHIRLTGSQLERFNTLKALFDEPGELQVQVHLDDTAQVLLETALNATGKTVTIAPEPVLGQRSFIARAAGWKGDFA